MTTREEAESKIREIVDRETDAWNNKDADKLLTDVAVNAVNLEAAELE